MGKPSLISILLCVCAATAGVGGGPNFSFRGTFTRDDQSEVFIFTAASSSVTIRTFGYAGGTNSAGTIIPAGGFDPVVSLFDATGSLGPASLLLGTNNDGASVPNDPVTGNALDSLLVLNSLTPGGRYAVVISQADNSPSGPDFGSGFHEDQGGATFTSGLFSCGGVSFCDASPAQRSGNWALDILGASGAANAIVNVSPQVSVTQTGFGRNRATGLWSANLTVTNTGSTAINAPIQVLFTNLTAGVTMVNNTGTRNGTPYLTVLPTGTLAAGASVTVLIQFQNPSNGFINFTPVTDYVQF
jgi:hypothetical protein